MKAFAHELIGISPYLQEPEGRKSTPQISLFPRFRKVEFISVSPQAIAGVLGGVAAIGQFLNYLLTLRIENRIMESERRVEEVVLAKVKAIYDRRIELLEETR